ncbi:MAG: pantoate--beta-alanine ligase [Chitinophagaceae bacterium]
MIIFKKANTLFQFLQQHKQSGENIGFVPTMGALHKGHLSLIKASKLENNITVCSIFINPAQFNNKEDFEKYPVTLEDDIEKLMGAECDILFLPGVEEIYSDHYVVNRYQLGKIESILEGEYRPKHFQGVCQVMDRLLQFVSPDELYLGQKDYQQCMVIKKLVEMIGKQEVINIKICETVREADGLAMSSRNLRLNNEQRNRAAHLFKTLIFIKEHFQHKDFNELKQTAKIKLQGMGIKVDYVEIADANTLDAAPTNSSKKLIALIAASIDNIRLIDNMALN